MKIAPEAMTDNHLIPQARSASHRSVRAILSWLVLACLLPGVIGATLLFAYEYRAARTQHENDMLQTARALMQAVDSHLLRGQALAQALSTADSLEQRDFAGFHARARDVAELSGLGTNVVLHDEAGRQLVNTAVKYGTPLPGNAAPELVREVFATGKPVVSDMFIGLLLNRPIMNVAVPVFIDGKVTYALSVGILPAHFNAILKVQNLPPDWVAAVLDSDGIIVGRNRTPEKFVGKKTNPLLLKAMTAAREGSAEAKTQEGTPVMSFFSRSKITDWGVAIGIPSQSLTKALVWPLAMLAAGITALFGIGLLLAWFIGGRIARSVTALTTPAMALGSGTSVPATQVHIREAADVAMAIDRAAALLQERAATLRIRDAQLAEAHRLAKFGTWHLDLVSGETTMSDTIRTIYGRELPPFPEQRGTVLPVESWERVNAALQETIQSGQGYDLELEVNHSSGGRIWINSKCEVVRNAGNEVVALRGTIQDITERKQYEQALRNSEQAALDAARQAQAERSRLAAVLEATPVGIVVVDAHGAVLQSNAANRRLWGENQPSADSMAAYHAWKGWWADGSQKHGQPVQAHEWPMVRALTGEDTTHDIIEIASFDDPPVRRIVFMSGAAIRDHNSTIIGGVIAQMDITERIRAEEALKQADRRKDEFLAMLAHELRNPLAPIVSAAELLGLGRLDDTRIRQTSAIIARQARHMTSLIDDLLDVSRVTRGLVALEKRVLDARQVVSDAVEQAKPLMEARGHRLAIHVPQTPALVLGDHKRLVQVMTNLLSNAVKFTRNNGDIVLDVKADGNQVCMSVTDNGIGMAPDLVEHAFELFAQGERTLDRSQGGLGIGLALVKSLVELHGGHVAVHSEGAGKGSRFTVFLPSSHEQRWTAADAEHGAEPRPAKTATASPLKVMVVDDNADAAQTLAMYIAALGHQVMVENSSRKALERADEEMPDICLLDIGLPEMDGNELARRLRAQPRTANVVLVAVTGYGNERDRQASLAAGFNHHMIKPVDTAQLAALLAEVGDAYV